MSVKNLLLVIFTALAAAAAANVPRAATALTAAIEAVGPDLKIQFPLCNFFCGELAGRGVVFPRSVWNHLVQASQHHAPLFVKCLYTELEHVCGTGVGRGQQESVILPHSATALAVTLTTHGPT